MPVQLSRLHVGEEAARVRNRTPSGASNEKPAPRPGTASMISWVCAQYSN